ncbi:MAG TPA: PAS domain S-box protein, partial [Acidobacteriota bacterium]
YEEKIPLHLEFRIVRNDGELRHISIVSRITKNPNGEPLLTGIMQDITDRKILEIQLRDTNEKIQLQNEAFRHAEQIGLFGSWQVNLSTREARYSENYFRIFGIKANNHNPGLEEFIQFIHPDDKSIFREIVKKIFVDQKPPEAEFRIQRNDGRTRNVRLKSKILRSAAGDQIIAGVVKDITSAFKLETELKETNEQLQLQNEAFRQAEKAINIGSWSWDPQSDQLQVSDFIYTLYGLKPRSVRPLIQNFEPFVHPMDRHIVQNMKIALLNNADELDIRFRITRSDGKLRYLRTRCHAIVSPERPKLIIGTTQDITDDVILNQQLKERISFAEMLSENIVDKVYISSASNIIIGWNAQAETAFGMKKEEMIGRNIFEALPKFRTPEVIEYFNKALNGEVVHVTQSSLPYVKGHHEITKIPIKNEEGEVTAVLTILHDITEHQRLKAELEDRLEFIERLIESSAHMIMVLDMNMKFLYWNKKSEEHYKLGKDKVIGRNILDIFPSFRKDETFHKIMQAWKGETVYIPVNREAKSDIYSDAYLIPIKGASNKVVAILWIVHELTELIKAEKEIKRQNELLESVLNAPNVGVTVYKSIRNESGEIIDFEFVMLSKRTQELIGRNNLAGKKLFEEFPDARNLENDLKHVAGTGEVRSSEHEVQEGEQHKWINISLARFGDGI